MLWNKRSSCNYSAVSTGRPNSSQSFEMASYSKGNVKRKRTVLSVKDKLNVCDMVRRNIFETVVMLKYNIGKSTVNDICKSEERLKNFKMTSNFNMAKCELGISKFVNAT